MKKIDIKLLCDNRDKKLDHSGWDVKKFKFEIVGLYPDDQRLKASLSSLSLFTYPGNCSITILAGLNLLNFYYRESAAILNRILFGSIESDEEYYTDKSKIYHNKSTCIQITVNHPQVAEDLTAIYGFKTIHKYISKGSTNTIYVMNLRSSNLVSAKLNDILNPKKSEEISLNI